MHSSTAVCSAIRNWARIFPTSRLGPAASDDVQKMLKEEEDVSEPLAKSTTIHTELVLEATLHDVGWAEFARFLQQMRRRRGLSQERLAQVLGCDRTYIWRLEHSRNHPSRIFMHNLQQSFELTAREEALLKYFASLREQH